MLRGSGSRQSALRVTSAAEASRLAADAYIFGYPLVLMDVTRQIATAAAMPSQARAPTNTFAHMRAFPDASFRDVVSPNADTLYSIAWLDLAPQPMVLSLPEMSHRYYVMAFLDAWTNVFASPGTRTTKGEAREFAVVGPAWKGPIPPTLERLDAPTNMVWVIGRTQTNGRRDFVSVHQLQEQYTLTPLSDWGTAYRPAYREPGIANLDLATPPVQQVAKMDAMSFFGCLNVLMQANPPRPADARALDRFAGLGIRPGPPMDDDGDLQGALGAGLSTGRTRLLEQARHPLGTVINGWEIAPRETGHYGTHYMLRAVTAMIGLGANLQEDTVSPHALCDGEGKPLHGSNRYVITFPAGGLPPVNAFWSITMYNARQGFVPNSLGRYAIGDRDDLVTARDGSVPIYIQHESPGADRESNWLPAPSEGFTVVMRLYWPSPSILNDRWRPPPIYRVA